MIKVILYIFCMLISFQILGQDTTEIKNDNLKNSVSVEILGATGYFSVNYDRTIFSSNKIRINQGLGVGYIIETDYTPFLLSYLLRTDIQYGDKKSRINPIIGYAFSHNFNLENSKAIYVVNNLVIGFKIKLNKNFSLLPKYYLMFFHEPHYDSNYVLNWGGLSIKYNF